jgi:arginine decarboxylase
MNVDQLRERNQHKAEAEAERGPVRAEPDATPIGDAIRAFHERNDLAFGIPAHRAGTGDVTPDTVAWCGDDAFRADVGMNMHVAMMTAVRPGETLVLARNGHKSAFSGLVLSGARPVYVDPVYDERWQVAHGVDPAALERTLDAHPEAKAVMMFTPTYYGISADVKALADLCHARGVPLITDDAWGLDYSFCSQLPPSALESGADLAVGSVHKTLNGFGQTSVLSVQGDLIDSSRLELVFELEQSTSASSLLLSSIDAARRQFQRDGEQLLGRAIAHARRLRAAIEELPGLDLMGEDVTGGPGAFAFDPTHVTFDVVALGLTGFSAADWLRQHQGIHVELADHRRVMALITYADSDHNIDRFIDALGALCSAHAEADRGHIPDVPYPGDLRMETVMLPRDAFLGATEMVPWREAAGRVSAEMICPTRPASRSRRPANSSPAPSSSTSSRWPRRASWSKAPPTRRSKSSASPPSSR